MTETGQAAAESTVPPRQREDVDQSVARLEKGLAELYGLPRENVVLEWTSDWSATLHVRFPPGTQYAHLTVVPAGPTDDPEV